MKILQINCIANSCSTGRIAEQIGELAQQEGWESYIAYGQYAYTSSSKLIRIASKFDLGIHFLETRVLDRHGLSSRWATKRLIQKIKEINPDIIHLHNIHGYYLNYPILCEYLISSGKPVVWTMHDCWALTGHCAYFDTANCERWKSGCYQCPLKSIYPKSIFADRSVKNYSEKSRWFTALDNLTIVAVSNWLNDVVKQSILKEKSLTLIHNGIDIKRFHPVEKIDSRFHFQGKKVLLGVGAAWTVEKGFNDFIELSKHISEEYCIVMLGVNDRMKKKLPHNIIGINKTENIDILSQLYSRALVLLTLSHNDTFPTTNLEALACGTPVITYPTGGSPEAVDDKTGFVVEVGDFDKVIGAIRIIDNKGKAFYSQNCRARALEYFDKDKQFAKYIELYKSITNKR